MNDGLNSASLAGRIEADIPTALGRIRTFRQSWSEPIDAVGCCNDHWLQLSLLPSTRTARACFPTRWRPDRFEPIGQLFLIPAHEPIHTKSECRSQIAVACIFTPEAFGDWLGKDVEWTDTCLKASLNIVNPTIRGLVSRIGNEVRRPGFASETLIELMAGQIIVELGRHYLAFAQERRSGGLPAWRLNAIDERLAEPCGSPTLYELARLVGLSVRQMERGFRASRGCSIGKYIAAARIERAKQLLTSDVCIKAVAHELGFASPSNFTTAFRSATGEAPRAYQQRVRRRSAVIAFRRALN